jgi:hypothetical protein
MRVYSEDERGVMQVKEAKVRSDFKLDRVVPRGVPRGVAEVSC